MHARLVWCVFIMLLPWAAWAESLAYGIVGVADDALVSRITRFLENLYAAPMRNAGSLDVATGDLTAQAEAARDLRRPDELLLLLVFGDLPGEDHGAILRDVPIAAVNISAMQPANPDLVPPEVFARRAERQAVRAIAFLLDLSYCPNPQCAAHPYQTLLELDELARDLCPPCLSRAHARLHRSTHVQDLVPPVTEKILLSP